MCPDPDGVPIFLPQGGQVTHISRIPVDNCSDSVYIFSCLPGRVITCVLETIEGELTRQPRKDGCPTASGEDIVDPLSRKLLKELKKCSSARADAAEHVHVQDAEHGDRLRPAAHGYL